MSVDHFTVDGTLITGWFSLESSLPRENDEKPCPLRLRAFLRTGTLARSGPRRSAIDPLRRVVAVDEVHAPRLVGP